jgi:hypothetical protein
MYLISIGTDLSKMTMTTEIDHGDHDAHAKGLAALMKIGYLPLNLLGTVRSGHRSDPSKKFQVSSVSSF